MLVWQTVNTLAYAVNMRYVCLTGLLKMKRFLKLALGLHVAAAAFCLPPAVMSQTGMFEFRWNQDPNYVKLDYKIDNEKANRRTDVILILSKKLRKTAILEMKIVAPEIFTEWNGSIDEKSVKVGLNCRQTSFLGTRTRCTDTDYVPLTQVTKDVPGVLRIIPEDPIPAAESVFVELRMKNPESGMYQFNAFASAPGDVPLMAYQGSWIIEID